MRSSRRRAMAKDASERHFAKHILAFCAGLDGITDENLAAQKAMENKHSDSSLVIERYIR